ncbi:hypothetical protein FRC08_015754 [Ceratobasidium sp. 394]|nr:hypothetical protein FRC08_015754 [Ceratobasidium sp. 394]KAG9089876.1 hypothetical protein FS749_000982 [Ceratobasidium sp. UAMH 11750]
MPTQQTRLKVGPLHVSTQATRDDRKNTTGSDVRDHGYALQGIYLFLSNIESDRCDSSTIPRHRGRRGSLRDTGLFKQHDELRADLDCFGSAGIGTFVGVG